MPNVGRLPKRGTRGEHCISNMESLVTQTSAASVE